MKKRFITGVLYVIVMAGLMVMKILIPVKDGMDYGALGVDILFWLISVIGAYEFTGAIGVHAKAGETVKHVREAGDEEICREQKTGGISKIQRIIVIVTCALLIPAFVSGKMIAIRIGKLYAASALSLVLLLAIGSLGAMITASVTVFDHECSDLKSTAYAELCLLYCGVLTCVAPNINHMLDNSEPAILMLFMIVPFVDVGAFFIGKLFGKLLPSKLAPHTSPNKTIVGAVGGVIGGILAAVIVWVICEYSPYIDLSYGGNLPKVVVLILISLITSVLAQLGDLFESAVKRGCGVKDMGKILPGHGGVLDRFDSMLFASVAIVVCFMAI